MEDYSYWKW